MKKVIFLLLCVVCSPAFAKVNAIQHGTECVSYQSVRDPNTGQVSNTCDEYYTCRPPRLNEEPLVQCLCFHDRWDSIVEGAKGFGASALELAKLACHHFFTKKNDFEPNSFTCSKPSFCYYHLYPL